MRTFLNTLSKRLIFLFLVILSCFALLCVKLNVTPWEYVKVRLSSGVSLDTQDAPGRKCDLLHKTTNDKIDDSGALAYLVHYQEQFAPKGETPEALPDPNSPDSVTQWWHAAAIIEWYLNSPIRYICKRKVRMGNWFICQDEPYTVRPPCLVYSFGIGFDFSFDDAMTKLGCEVHSFDPSMRWADQERGNKSTFHNLGIGATNADDFVPKLDEYVTKPTIWKVRTAKGIMAELGHENQVIDVFKMDVEGYEWTILENMLETNVFRHIRQFLLEFHLFPKFPLKTDYVKFYQVYTRLRKLGFREFRVSPHGKIMNLTHFNLQGDCVFVNAFFQRESAVL